MEKPLQDNPDKKVTEIAGELNQNTPLTPMGAGELGATPKQTDMMGTPAQRDAALRQQQQTQQQEQERQIKEQETEKARLEGTTLQQAQRYATPADTATKQQQQAQQLSESLRTLGPVQTRVQSLIQKKLEAVQEAETALQVDEGAIDAIATLDEDKREAAKDAIQAYIDNPSESALQKIYDTLGYAQTEDIATLFAEQGESIRAALEGQLTTATIGDIYEEEGIDIASIAKQLGMSEEEFKALSLDELYSKISEVEASEFSEIERLNRIISDPTASPTLKQQAREQLAQMGAVGVVGVEEQVDTVLDQVAKGNTLEILGREFSLEEALSDEGISSLIVKAVNDEEILQSMLDSEEFKSLAEWIQKNKDDLQEAVEESEEEAASFIDIQDDYAAFRNSLGEGEEERKILEALFPGIDFENSVLSTEFEGIQETKKVNPLFDLATGDVFFKNLLLKGGEGFVGDVIKMLDGDFEDLLKKAAAKDEEAISKLEKFKSDVEFSIEVSRAFEEEDILKSIYGDDYLGESGLITDTAKLSGMENQWQVFKDIKKNKPKILIEVAKFVEDADKYGFGDNPEQVFDNLKALYEIEGDEVDTDAEIRQKIYDDLISQKSQKAQLKEKGITAKSSADDIHGYLFNTTGLTALDLNYALETMDKEAKELILAIFDEGKKDGKISEEELRDGDLYKDLVEAFGLDEDAASIIEDKGAFKDYEDLLMGIVDAGASKNSYAKAATTELSPIFASTSEASIGKKANSEDGKTTYLGMYTGAKAGIPEGGGSADYLVNVSTRIQELIGDTLTATENVLPTGDRDWFKSISNKWLWHNSHTYKKKVQTGTKKVWVSWGSSGQGKWVDEPIYKEVDVTIPAIETSLMDTLSFKSSDVMKADGTVDTSKIHTALSNLQKLRNQTATRYAWLVENPHHSSDTQAGDLRQIEPKIDAAMQQLRNLLGSKAYSDTITSYRNTKTFLSKYKSAAKAVNNISSLLATGEGASNANVKKAIQAVNANPFAYKLLSATQKAIIDKHLKYFT